MTPEEIRAPLHAFFARHRRLRAVVETTAILLSAALILGGVFIAYQDHRRVATNYESQRHACDRGNVLRETINETTRAVRALQPPSPSLRTRLAGQVDCQKAYPAP